MVEKLPNKEFQEISQEFIRQVEVLNLSIEYKQELLLVAGKIKPSAWISFAASAWQEGKTTHTTFQNEMDIEVFYKVLKDSNLYFEISPRKTGTKIEKVRGVKTNFYKDIVEVLVANSNERLIVLSKIIKTKPLDHERLGKILGIPETAVETFVGKKKRLNLYRLPKEILSDDSFLFTPTRTLSEDNWETEIDSGNKIAKFLKKVSPQIYKEVQDDALEANEQQGLISDKTRAKWSKKSF